VSRQTGARVEDRLDRMGYLLGHLVKSQKKVSNRVRVMEKGSSSKQEAASTASYSTNSFVNVQPARPNLLIAAEVNESPLIQVDDNNRNTTLATIAMPTKETPLLPRVAHQRAYSTDHIHPIAAQSQIEDNRRNSISSEFTATESEISGVSDLTLSELDLGEILRPGSIYSLTSMIDASNSLTSPKRKAKTKAVQRKRMITLFEVLSRRTLPPWDLFHFYLFMRDEMRSVDYIDCW
jgi:hypothetical protein